MIHYAIFFASIAVAGLLGVFRPVGAWWRSFLSRGMTSMVLALAFTVPFLGGRGGPDAADVLGTAGPSRLLRLGALLVLLFVVATGFMRSARPLQLAGKAAMAMLAYAVLAMFSALYSVSPLISALKGFEVFVLVMTGIHLAGQLRTLADVRWLVDTLALIILVLVVSALIGAVVLPSQAFPATLLGATILQGVAPVINANTLTQFSVFIALLCFIYAFNGGSERRGQSNWIVFGVALVAVILSHSRTSIFSGAVALVAVLFFSGRKSLAIAATAGGSIAWFATEFLASYLMRGQSEEQFMSFSGRMVGWERTWDIVAESPIVGHGFYAAQRVLLGSSTVDSTYMDVLIGLGFVGLVALLIPVAITAWSFLVTIPGKKDLPAYRLLWLELMSLFVIILVRSVTAPTFQVMHPNLVMFMVLIVSVAALRRLRVRVSRKAGPAPADEADEKREPEGGPGPKPKPGNRPGAGPQRPGPRQSPGRPVRQTGG